MPSVHSCRLCVLTVFHTTLTLGQCGLVRYKFCITVSTLSSLSSICFCAELLESNPSSCVFNMESLILNAPNVIGASILIAALYLIFHLVLKPKSHLDKLPSLGKSSDPYLQELLVEGRKKVRTSFNLNTWVFEHLLTPRQYLDTPYTIPEVPHSSKKKKKVHR